MSIYFISFLPIGMECDLGEGGRGGGSVHSILTVRVFAAHMGGLLGPNFSKQGSPFPQMFL